MHRPGSNGRRGQATGNFWLAGLPIAGSYDITAGKPSFADAHLSNVTLAAGTTADLNLQLNVAEGQTEITVTGVVGGIRPQNRISRKCFK